MRFPLWLALVIVPLLQGQEPPAREPARILAPAPAALLATLREAPATATIAGQTFTLEGGAWRDFMPTVGPADESGLMVSAVARPADGSRWDARLRVDRIWVVHGTDVWDTPVSVEERPEPNDAVARHGPLWTPGDAVTVVARIAGPAGASVMIRAPAGTIERTE